MTITDYLNSMKVLVLFLIFTLPDSLQATTYGAFGNHTQGSSRVLGLGGAFTAISNDSNAFYFNPAGPTLSDLDLQFEASTTQLTNNELSLNESNFLNAEYVPQQFDLVGIHYKKGRFSFGLGYLVPYWVEVKSMFPTSLKSLKIQETGVNVSYALSDSFAFGINGKYSQATQLQQVAPSTKDEISPAITYWQWGLIYSKKRWAIGYSFSPELLWQKTASTNTLILDVASPEKQVVGLSYFIKPDKIRFTADIISVKKLQNSVAFETNSSFENNPIKSEDVTFPKLGIEFLLVQNSRTNAQFRMGYYDEPARFQGSESRQHFCIGFEVRLGPALLQIAQDQAKNFNTTSQALSVIFDKL